MAEEAARVVRIERTLDAPAEDVFDAWTSEEVISRWFRPKEGWREADAEVDLRVGGRIRVMMRTPDGEPVGAGGEYTLIERPHRLAFTWTFDDDRSNEQMIELEFTERDGATTVLFVNSDISDGRRRDSQYEGWSTCFDEIGRVLASM
ncbi:MAG: SRPBCC domain-containing protein [Solirubrobacterales bacterium]